MDDVKFAYLFEVSCEDPPPFVSVSVAYIFPLLRRVFCFPWMKAPQDTLFVFVRGPVGDSLCLQPVGLSYPDLSSLSVNPRTTE